MSDDDFFAGAFGTFYSALMERRLISRIYGLSIWGGDTKRYYEMMESLADTPAGNSIVDCPCGAGPALRSLGSVPELRYVGADASPVMLERAKRKAQQHGATNAKFVRGNAQELPFEDNSADIFLSLWGLHCFDDPLASIVEASRILKPGGRLLGASFVTGKWLRQRLLVKSGRGGFGNVGSVADVESWLSAANLTVTSTSQSGPMFFFEATA